MVFARAKMIPQARRRAAARAEAQSLVTTARRVFIIYSSADLALARDVRDRIVHMRRNRADDSVFLAAESLPVGTDVSPEVVRDELAAADVAVVVCEEQTSRSPFVIEEVQQTLRQRERGQTAILPVILKASVKLPDGLDVSIQAIHRLVLFPAIKWTRISVIAALAILAVFASMFAGRAMDETRRKQIAEIQHRIELDDLSQNSPVDLGRAAALVALRTRAQDISFEDGVRKLDQKLQVSATPPMRQEWLASGGTRIGIVADPSANVVWVGYTTRIDGLDAETRKAVRTFDRTALEVDAWEPESILGREPARGPKPPRRRHSALLVGIRSDPRLDGIQADVEYEQFADVGGRDEDYEPDKGER